MENGNPFASTFQTGRHYKVHRSYIVVGPLTALVALLVLGTFNSLSSIIHLSMAVRSGDVQVSVPLVVGLVFLGIVLAFGLLVGLYALAWRNMSYVFDAREFSYYSGIITKRRVHVPYSRVQSVNHRASLVQRIAGVCTVTIDSAGGASNKGVRVPYLRLETAERLRTELFMRKAAVEVGREDALVYLSQYDSASAEGAQFEAAHKARQRGQAPTAPVSSSAASQGAANGAAVTGVPGNADGFGAAGSETSWVCPQCGKGATGTACASCGYAVAAQSPNVLDSAVGFAGELRGLYGGISFGEEAATYEYGLSNHELLLTTVSHDKPIVVSLVVALSFVVTFAFVLLAQDEFALFLSSVALPIVIGSAVATWVFGLATVALSYGNFRARRRGSRIEVERGVLAREASGIDIARVQSIEVRQSFIRRCIGYCELSLGRIDSAGEQNKGNNNSKSNTQGLVIHPFVKLDRVDDILDGLAPELSDRPRRVECATLPSVALRRAILRRCLWYNWMLWIAVALGICWAVIGAFVSSGQVPFASDAAYAQYNAFMTWSLVLVIAVCALITVARGVGAVLWARHSGYTWNQSYLFLHNDGLSTSDSIIPRWKIQAAATRSNPFQRRLSLATLQAITAVGTSQTTARLVDVPADDANSYLDWVKPRNANTSTR